MKRAGQGIGKTILYVVLGLAIGSLAGNLLSHFRVPYMNTFQTWIWHPAGDLGFIKYDLVLALRLNLMSLVGVVVGFWLLKRS
jgi:Domain of unknown function (DUF4321)